MTTANAPIRTNGIAWVKPLREAAMAAFEAQGLPTVRDELWKYTNLKVLQQTPFEIVQQPGRIPARRDIEPWLIEGLDAALAVFVDGHFDEKLSDLTELGAGVTVLRLADAMGDQRKTIERYLGKLVDVKADAFGAWNTAFLDDGIFIHVCNDAKAARPLHILSITTQHARPTVTHPRNLIVAEAGARIEVIEQYAHKGDGVYLTNAMTELFADERARVHHYLIERESEQAYNVSTLKIHQKSNTDVHSHSALFGGRLVRNNVHPILDGDDIHCLINGLYVGHGDQHLDNNMRVEHKGLHGDSRQFYKGILDDRAHGVFTGRIIVHPGAQKTDAKQTNRNMLLSDDAQMQGRPQLEIYADDVKCTHGATTGQVDDEMVFYLKSRGISADVARSMMIFAFAAETFQRIELAPIENLLRNLLADRLPGAATLVEDLEA